jgi:hypothetical protein
LCAAQAALSTEALWLLTHTAPKQTSHGVEETLTTFRSLRASVDMLSYYSLQRSWAQRPQLVQQTAPHVVVHLSQGISSVSDTYINAVIDAWYYEDAPAVRPLPLRSLPSSSFYVSSQVFAAVVRARHMSTRRRQERPSLQATRPGSGPNGEKGLLPNVLKVMNEWGGCGRERFHRDHVLQRSVRGATFANLQVGCEQAWAPQAGTDAVLDNPHRELGRGFWRANLWLGGGKKRFGFPGEIKLVVSAEAGDSACRDLRAGDRVVPGTPSPEPDP